MKKHLLRSLCIAFVLTLCLPMVACDFQLGGLVGELLADNAPNGGVMPDQWESDLVIEDILPEIETAIDTAWDEDFTGDIAIEMPTEAITNPPFTEVDTTEPPTTDAPVPDPVLFFSFDEGDAWIGEQKTQQFFTPGAHASWDGTATIDDYCVEYVRIWGWVAFSSTQIGEIGYCIDYDEYVFDQAFFVDTEPAILDAATNALGAGSASRISIMVPVRSLSGEHVIEIVARDEFGYLEIIGTFTLDKAVDPYAPISVPVESWAVSGLCPEIIPYDGHMNSPIIQAGGIEQGALLHQGSVGIGEIDLSKYEKMIVYYGIDNSEVTITNYNNNPSNRIMITSKEIHMIDSPEESDIIASTVYTLQGWQVVPIEIDLTGIDYNGSVYVTYDTLPGTFMVIGAIYLVPYAE